MVVRASGDDKYALRTNETFFFKELIHLDVFASIGNSLHHIVIKMSSNARDGERKRRGWQRIKIKISIGIFSAHFSIFCFKEEPHSFSLYSHS